MYIKRIIDKNLLEWKNLRNHKPLLLRGVRQCGKTSAVRNLATTFETYIELNLEKQRNLCSIFDGNIDCTKIINKLELEYSTKIIAGKTLLFIDEIQECPNAITALRYFYEEMPDLHIITAGSLLEFVLRSPKKNKLNFPVGRVRSIYMYPFSFKEFLCAIGQNLLCDYLDNALPFQEENTMHEKLLDFYKDFLIVGGMPEAVVEYVETKSLFSCQQIHNDILANFKDDFAKYNDSVPTDILSRVFDFALQNVCTQVKASSAIAGISSYYFELCIKLLNNAGLVYPVKASDCHNIPIGGGEKNANKKLIFFDSGIYLTENHLDVSGLISAKIFDDMNKGNIVEMQTGLEMIKNSNSFVRNQLYYWYQTGANAEVDFVYQKGTQIIPIEVKASNKGSMQSMRSYLQKYKAPFGIRISLENFTQYDNIKVYPVYAVDKLF